MALKTCKECGSKVSTKADSCPQCGARIKSKPLGCGSLLALIVLGLIFVSAIGGFNDSGDSSDPPISSPVRTDIAEAGNRAGNNAETSARTDDNNVLATKKPTQSAWNVHSFKAEMDGHKIWNASTNEEHAYGQLSWPANNVTAHITVGKDRGDKFVVLVFSDSPNLVGGQIQHGYTIHKLPVSFDGKTNELTITQKWGSPNLYAKYPTWFINKMKAAKNIKIRMPWYRQAAMYFKFDVSGLEIAVGKFK